MPTTTELAEQYIGEHPSIKDCLKQDLINYSKLSRKIAKELGIEKKTSMEAILIACRRFQEKLNKEFILEKQILNLLKKSELEIKNKIVVAIVNKESFSNKLKEIENKIRKTTDIFYAIEGTKVYTIITSQKYLEDIKTLFGKTIKKINQDLAMITIKSPETLEDIPGVMSYIYSRFGEHGVNISETMSCWTDSIFIISEEDIPLVMKFLKF